MVSSTTQRLFRSPARPSGDPQKLPTLRNVVEAYRRKANQRGLDPEHARMLDRLSTSKEAVEAFTALALSEATGLTFVKDCLTAHRLDKGEHKRQVERLRSVP